MSEKPTGIPEIGKAEVRGGWAGRLERGLENTRSAVQTVFSGRPDAIKLVESLKLEDGFTEAVDTQRTFQLLKPGASGPDFDQILRIFTPEMLVAAQDFKTPTLVLNAEGRSSDDLVAAMDGHKTILLQRNAKVDTLFSHCEDRKVKNCGAHIVEGAAEMDIHDFDNIYAALKRRVELFADYKRTNSVGGMNLLRYLPLMMQYLKKRQTIDAKSSTATILDEELVALLGTHIPYAYWNPFPWRRGVNIDWTNTDKREQGFRFRRSVGGDVSM